MCACLRTCARVCVCASMHECVRVVGARACECACGCSAHEPCAAKVGSNGRKQVCRLLPLPPPSRLVGPLSRVNSLPSISFSAVLAAVLALTFVSKLNHICSSTQCRGNRPRDHNFGMRSGMETAITHNMRRPQGPKYQDISRDVDAEAEEMPQPTTWPALRTLWAGCGGGAGSEAEGDPLWRPAPARTPGSQEVATQLEKENRCEGPAALFRGGDAECQDSPPEPPRSGRRLVGLPGRPRRASGRGLVTLRRLPSVRLVHRGLPACRLAHPGPEGFGPAGHESVRSVRGSKVGKACSVLTSGSQLRQFAVGLRGSDTAHCMGL